jgi:hypothetical protein
MFIAGCTPDIVGQSLSPVLRRLAAMKCFILISVEEIHCRAWDTTQSFEISNGTRIHVDSTDAAKFGLHIPNTRRSFVKATSCAACAAEHMEVANFFIK